jgi:hypothetical protein
VEPLPTLVLQIAPDPGQLHHHSNICRYVGSCVGSYASSGKASASKEHAQQTVQLLLVHVQCVPDARVSYTFA